MPEPLQLYIPLTKVDLQKGEVWGLMTAEQADAAREILDYARSKPLIQEWSDVQKAASGGKSLGNVREQHNPHTAAGKVIALQFNDTAQHVAIGAKVVDPVALHKCEEGVYTGFSIGGEYAWRAPDPARPGYIRYAPRMGEVSLVDRPCLAGATFHLIRADGVGELRKFAPVQEMPPMDEPSDPVTKAEAAVHEAPAANPAQQVHDLLMPLGMPCPNALGEWEGVPWTTDILVWRQVHDLLVAMGATHPHLEMSMDRAVADGDLAKAGRTISTRNAAHVQAIHDHAIKLGATPRPGDAAPAADAAPVAKALDAGVVAGIAPDAGHAIHELIDVSVTAATHAASTTPTPGELVAKAATAPAPELPPDPAITEHLTALETRIHEQQTRLTKAATDYAALAARLATLEGLPAPAPGPLLRVDTDVRGTEPPPAPVESARIGELRHAIAKTTNPQVRAELQRQLRLVDPTE